MIVSSALDLEPASDTSASASSAVGKAMIVLSALTANEEPLTLAELSRRTGLAKSTVHRLLVVLRAHRAVSLQDGAYRIGAWMSNPVRPDEDQFRAALRGESTPYLVELHNATGGVAGVYVLSGKRPSCVNQIYDHRSVRGSSMMLGFPAAHPVMAKVLHSCGAELDEPASPAPAMPELPTITSDGMVCAGDAGHGFVVLATPLHGPGNRLRQPVALAVSGRAELMDTTAAARELRRSAYELTRVVRHRLAKSGAAAR